MAKLKTRRGAAKRFKATETVLSANKHSSATFDQKIC